MVDLYLFLIISVFEGNGKILRIEETDKGQIGLILDQTIFFPQGGGQPFDIGIIYNSQSKFKVTEVKKNQ